MTWQRAALLALVGALAACGGASAGSTPRGAEGERDYDDRSPERAGEDEETQGSGESEDTSTSRMSCDDGTCFECGDGMCPSGFYCDESAAGGAACSWLPTCAAQATCKCVRKALGGGCSCEERAGGTFVSCR
jgi:hypothetical protein